MSAVLEAVLRWVREGLYPGEPRVSRDKTKYTWGERETERGDPGLPELPSGKVVGRTLCFWSQQLVAV